MKIDPYKHKEKYLVWKENMKNNEEQMKFIYELTNKLYAKIGSNNA